MHAPRSFDLHDGTPFWPRRDGILATHPRLDRDVSCQVAVVGGGITGSLCALELTRRGLDVVLLDRRDVGGGSTSASTSMLQYEIDELLVDLTQSLGEENAVAAYRECRRGIDLVEAATQAAGDTCGFRRSPSVFMAVRQRDVATLRREFDARKAAGFEVTWIDSAQLQATWGLRAAAAIQSSEGASVDPYRLAYAAIGKVIRRGGRVFDRTAVERYDLSSRRARLETEWGHTITADHVLMAVGYEVKALLPDLPLSLLSSFALVSEPMPSLERRFPDGLLFWDYDDPYLYGRVTDDLRLLVGGRDESYRDPRRRRRALPAKTAALARDAQRKLPALDDEFEVAFSWCGTFAETPDGLAYIGGHPDAPRCHFALGFGGNGITYSALAAEYLADDIQRVSRRHDQLFALTRPVVHPSD